MVVAGVGVAEQMIVAQALTEFAELSEKREYRDKYGDTAASAAQRLDQEPGLLMNRFVELHKRLFPTQFGDRTSANSLDRNFSQQENANMLAVANLLDSLTANLLSTASEAHPQMLAETYARIYQLSPFGAKGTMVVLDALFCELAETGIIHYDLRNAEPDVLNSRRTLLGQGINGHVNPDLARIFGQIARPYQEPDLENPAPLPYRISAEEMGPNLEAIANRPLPGQSEAVTFADGVTYRMVSITNPELHTHRGSGVWDHTRTLRGTYVLLADGGLVEAGAFRDYAAHCKDPTELRVPRDGIDGYLMSGPVPAGLLLNAQGRNLRFDRLPEIDGIPLNEGVPATSLDVDYFTNLTLGKGGELERLKKAVKNFAAGEAAEIRNTGDDSNTYCAYILAALTNALEPIRPHQQAVRKSLLEKDSPLRDNMMMLMLGDRAFAEALAEALPDQAGLIAKAHERLSHTDSVLWKEFKLQMARGQLGEELKSHRRTVDGKSLFVVTAGPSAAGKSTSINAMTFLLGADVEREGSKELFNQAYVFSGLDRGRQLLDTHTLVRSWVDGNHDYPDTSYIGDISRNVLLELAKCCGFNVVRDGSGVPSYKTEAMIEQLKNVPEANGNGLAYQVFMPVTTAPLLGRSGTRGTLQRSALRFYHDCPDGSYEVNAPFNEGFVKRTNESTPHLLEQAAASQGIAIDHARLAAVYDPLKGLEPAMGLPQNVPIEKNLLVAREFHELARAAHTGKANLIGIDNSGPVNSSHSAIMTGVVVTESDLNRLATVRDTGGDLFQAFREMNLVPWRIARPKPGETQADFSRRGEEAFGFQDNREANFLITSNARVNGRSEPTYLISVVYDAEAMRLVMDQGKYGQVESGHALRVSSRLAPVEAGLAM